MEALSAARAAHPMVKALPEMHLREAREAEPAERTTKQSLEASVEAPLTTEPTEAPAEAAAEPMPVRHVRSERMALTVRTQEGDMVRLQFSSRESVSIHPDYAETHELEIEGTRDSEPMLVSRTATKVMVKVQGELNADELAAVQDALDQATELAEEFFGADVQSAFEQAAHLEIDAAQLARFSFRATFMERVTYAPVVSSEPAVAELVSGPAEGERAPEEIDAEPLVSAAPVAPSAGDSADADPVVEAPVDVRVDGAVEPSDEASAEGASTGGAEAADGADAPEAAREAVALDPLEILSDFFRSLSERLGLAASVHGDAVLDVSLKMRMFETVVETLTGAETEGSPLPAVLSESLEAVAERQPAPLDEVA